MKACSNTKSHKILNQNRIIFDGNKCGSNQCYKCITNIFHSTLANEEEEALKDKLGLDCGCVFQRQIILNFLNRQCFNSIEDEPYYSELRSNKISMRHPVKRYVSKKKWQEKIENFTHQQQKSPKEAHCINLTMILASKTNKTIVYLFKQFFQTLKTCGKCQFAIEASYAITFLFGNNTKQPSYLCLNCHLWRQWTDNTSSAAQRYPQHIQKINHNKNTRKRGNNRLSPIVFHRIQDKFEKAKPLSASKNDQ